jgi:HEAT repeat protein
MSIDNDSSQQESPTTPAGSVDRLIEQLNDPSPEVRIRAAEEVGRLGPKARAASWPLKMRFLHADDPEERRTLSAALAAISPQAKESAQYLLSLHRDRQSNREWARTLSVANARKVIDNLIWSIADSIPPSDELTEQGKRMVALGVEMPEIIPDLIQAFRADTAYRGQLGVLLDFVADQRPEATEQLLGLLWDESPDVVEAAALTLASVKTLGPRGGDVVRTLFRLFERERDDDTYGAAAKALVSLRDGDWVGEVVSRLVGMIRAAPEWEPSWVPGVVLKDIIFFATDTRSLTALLDLMQDENPQVREVAARTCRGVDKKEALLALCQALKDEESSVRYQAVCALAECPRKWAGEVVPHLIEALRDSDPRIRGEAAYDLGKLRDAAAPALSALREGLEAENAISDSLRAQYQAARNTAIALRDKLKQARAVARRFKNAIKNVESADS